MAFCTSPYRVRVDAPTNEVADSRLPERPRELINDLYVLACHWLHAPLQHTFDTFINHLDEPHDTPSDQGDALGHMQTRHALEQTRNEVERRFLFCIGEAFHRLGGAPHHAITSDAQPGTSSARQTPVCLQHLLSSGMAHSGPALFKLGYRFAVLAGVPPLEGHQQPLGPQALTAAFIAAIMPLQLPHHHRLMLLTCFENAVLDSINDLHKQANHQLLADGVLPQLHVHLPAAAPTPAATHARGQPLSHTTTRGSLNGLLRRGPATAQATDNPLAHVQLEAKLEALIDRANREQPVAGLHTVLLADIEQHLNMLDLRAQIAQRRHQQSIQTSERISKARQRVNTFLDDRLDTAKPPVNSLLRALIKYIWADVLVFALLKDKPQNTDGPSVWTLTDQLLGLAPVADRQQLQSRVQTKLFELGMDDRESMQTTQSLVATEPVQMHVTDLVAGTANAPRIEVKTFEKTLLQSATDMHAAADPSSDEARLSSIHARLRQLPFGTWFAFIDPVDGHIQQRKLAWYSTVSGQALFVAGDGEQTLELKLDALARQIRQGSAHELQRTHEGMLDKAWRNVASSWLHAGSAAAQQGARR